MNPVSELMSRNPVTLHPENTIVEAVSLMKDKGIGAVLIHDNGEDIGIFTERDILTKVEFNDPAQISTQKINTVMTKNLITVDQEKPYTQVIEIMLENKIRHLPVMENGNIVGIVSLRDLMTHNNKQLSEEVLERKKIENDLRVAYIKLKRAQDQLIESEKSRVIGTLAAGVAHEVKNPLMVMQQAMEYISKVVPKDDKNVVLLIEYSFEAIENANKVIKGLLDFSRLSELSLDLVDINALLQSTLSLLKHQLGKGKIELFTELDFQLPHVKIDKNKMGQVIFNLMINAIQAVPEGGKITVNTKSKIADKLGMGVGRRQTDRFNINDRLLIFEIENSGSPIPDDLINKIFDPFVTSKRELGGSGLGLPIVRSIIDLHKGFISIVNKEEGVLATVILKI